MGLTIQKLLVQKHDLERSVPFFKVRSVFTRREYVYNLASFLNFFLALKSILRLMLAFS